MVGQGQMEMMTADAARRQSIADTLTGCRDCYTRLEMLRELAWEDEVRAMLEASARVGRYLVTGK